MKATAEKSTHTTPAGLMAKPAQPFFSKGGEGNFFSPAPVQTKLAVNTPGDKYEVEADQMAAKVMRMSGSGRQKREKELESQPVKRLQRMESASIQLEERPAQQQGDGHTQMANEQTAATIRSKTSGGQPLPAETRSFMEPRFGNDFSNVRIHHDQGAAQLNTQLNARAFTYQNHILFGEGQYQPQSPEGKQLLAHELTHVDQQWGAKGLNSKSAMGSTSDYTNLQTKPSVNSSPVIQRGVLDDPASNIQGYFEGRKGKFEWHDSKDTFYSIDNNNVDSATDEAGFWGYPPPWKKGRYDWVIPNHFRVISEGGDVKKFTEVNQIHTIEGTNGTAKITKAGAEVERTP